MIKKLERKLNGFRASWRNKHINLQHLCDEEFRLLEIYIDLAVWDKINHKEIYGTTDITNADIARLWGCSDSKVSRWKKSLLERGDLIREREDGRIEILNFSKYKIKEAHTLMLAKTQDTLSETQGVDAELQDFQTNTDSDTKHKTRVDKDKNRGNLAKMQTPFSSKGLVSFNNSLDTPPRKKEGFEVFAKRAMAELKRNDPLKAGSRVVSSEEMAAAGFDSSSLHEPCPICKSGVDFIDCCGPAMCKSLEGVKG